MKGKRHVGVRGAGKNAMLKYILAKGVWEPCREASHMLRVSITDPQQYYSAGLRCYDTATVSHVLTVPRVYLLLHSNGCKSS
jgi:hypothetical protein